MKNTYEIDFHKIYLQNFTHATSLSILMFSSTSYAFASTGLLKRNALEKTHFELTVFNQFTHIEFRVMSETVLLASETKEQFSIQELFYCPVEIDIYLKQSSPSEFKKYAVYAAVNLLIDSKLAPALYYEFDCGEFAIFKRVKEDLQANECVELVLDELLPYETRLTVFQSRNRFFLPIFMEPLNADVGFTIYQDISVSSEFSMLVKDYNRRGEVDFQQIVRSFPLQHPVFSYTLARCAEIYSAVAHIKLKPGFVTIYKSFYKNEFNELTFYSFKMDYYNAHYMVRNVFYYDEQVPFLAIQNAYFASFVSQFIFNQVSLNIFCNGEHIRIKELSFPAAPDEVIVKIEPYTFYFYGVRYAPKAIEIEDEEITISKNVSHVESEVAQVQLDTQHTTELKVVANSTISVIFPLPCKHYDDLRHLYYVCGCWERARNSLAALSICRPKHTLSHADLKQLEELDAQLIGAEWGEQCTASHFGTLMRSMPLSGRIRLIMQFLNKLCTVYCTELQMAENEVIIQRLTRLVYQRNANKARNKRISILTQNISECKERIRQLEHEIAEDQSV